MSELVAMLYKHGNDDYGIWWLDLPQEAHDKIEVILDEYRNRGCSTRGTAADIANEILE